MPPNDPYALAIWLFDTLEEAHPAGGTLWEGRLPASLDFDRIQAHITNVSGRLVGVCNARSRTIEFHPRNVDVYQDLPELIGVAANRRRVPDRFVIRSPEYHHPTSDQQATPDDVASYVAAVDLWVTLKKLADIGTQNALHFVASHDAQLEVQPDFTAAQLRPIPALAVFAAEIAQPPHEDQKRAIVRATLTDHFKPRRRVQLGDVISEFESIATDARRSLAMYMAEFSVKKVLGEVERQNLDDTLSLNKTLSDIQNQLLALPAAILLAGATIKPGEIIRNWAVFAGMIVFCVLIWVLAGNQRHSVNAISTQIQRRKAKVDLMPADTGQEILTLFSPLQARVARQRRTLTGVAVVVGVVALLTAAAVVDANYHGMVVEGIARTWRHVSNLLLTAGN